MAFIDAVDSQALVNEALQPGCGGNSRGNYERGPQAPKLQREHVTSPGSATRVSRCFPASSSFTKRDNCSSPSTDLVSVFKQFVCFILDADCSFITLQSFLFAPSPRLVRIQAGEQMASATVNVRRKANLTSRMGY